jgi:hypothetical protein
MDFGWIFWSPNPMRPSAKTLKHRGTEETEEPKEGIKKDCAALYSSDVLNF